MHFMLACFVHCRTTVYTYMFTKGKHMKDVLQQTMYHARGQETLPHYEMVYTCIYYKGTLTMPQNPAPKF